MLSVKNACNACIQSLSLIRKASNKAKSRIASRLCLMRLSLYSPTLSAKRHWRTHADHAWCYAQIAHLRKGADLIQVGSGVQLLGISRCRHWSCATLTTRPVPSRPVGICLAKECSNKGRLPERKGNSSGRQQASDILFVGPA